MQWAPDSPDLWAPDSGHPNQWAPDTFEHLTLRRGVVLFLGAKEDAVEQRQVRSGSWGEASATIVPATTSKTDTSRTRATVGNLDRKAS